MGSFKNINENMHPWAGKKKLQLQNKVKRVKPKDEKSFWGAGNFRSMTNLSFVSVAWSGSEDKKSYGLPMP